MTNSAFGVPTRAPLASASRRTGRHRDGRVPLQKLLRVGDGVTLFKTGDRVWGSNQGLLGRQGTFAEYVCAAQDWFYPTPAGVTDVDAAAAALVGITAHLGLFRCGKLQAGETVFVNGGAGGVGSMAIALLADLGYTVESVTGRAEEAAYLEGLGAAAVVERAEVSGPPRLLGKERWAAGVDAVGSTILANVISMIKRRGAVAVCGNAAGMDLPTSVAPFILRGVSLLGVDSVMAPKEERIAAWSRLARHLDRDLHLVRPERTE